MNGVATTDLRAGSKSLAMIRSPKKTLVELLW